MATTKIDRADAVWNPITGSMKISDGCNKRYIPQTRQLRARAATAEAVVRR